MFFIFRGSVLPQIWRVLLVNIVLAIVVTLSHGNIYSEKITLTSIPFTLIGLPLAIFLSFRNNATYDRYCEGRKLWGEIVLQSRNFSRQCLSLIEHSKPISVDLGLDDIRVRMIYRIIAFSHALRIPIARYRYY